MIIVKYREIAIKGRNRVDFEKALQRNIKDCLKKNNISFEKVERKRGRIIVYTNEECPQLQHVFGVSGFSYAQEYEQSMDAIKEAALSLYKEGKTFCVRCQRSDKVLKKSTEIEREVGAHIVLNKNAKVSLREPEQTIFIELLNNKAYIYNNNSKGPGGLPIGTGGHAVLKLDSEKTIEAGKRIMKRGVKITVYKEKDVDYSELKEYEYGFRMKEIDFMPEDVSAVVVSDTIKTIQDYPYFVLRPLI